MHVNIRFLETFIWVAKLRSFKAAAGKLHISQAAISGRIAALEDELQLPLFQRGNRDISLTDAGSKFMHYAQKMVNTERAMRDAMQEARSLNGTVRLGIVESIVHTWFGSFIKELQETHPDIEIEITAESTRRLHQLVKRGGLDVALQTDPILGDEVRNRDLGSLRMAWICAGEADIPDFPDLATLFTWPIVTFPRHSQPHLHLLELIQTFGLKPRRLHFVSSIAASTRLIEAGVGVAALPLAAVSSELRTGRYRQIHCEPPLPNLRLVASWRPDPIAGLAEAVVALALKEMKSYASGNSQYAGAPIDSGVLVL